jgi:hypothetical protein
LRKLALSVDYRKTGFERNVEKLLFAFAGFTIEKKRNFKSQSNVSSHFAKITRQEDKNLICLSEK